MSLPMVSKVGLEPSKWTRQRHNYNLFTKVCEPLEVLHNTPADPWSFVNGKFVYASNPEWEAAQAEYNRRYNLYMQCKPVPSAGAVA